MSRTISKTIVSKAITEAQFEALVSALEMVLPAAMPADVALHQFFRGHPEMGMRIGPLWQRVCMRCCDGWN